MKDLKPGIYTDIPFDEYLDLPCFSKSFVDPILKSPKHLKHYFSEKQKSSPIMAFGSLVDALLLDQKEVERRFFKIPDTYINGKGEEKPWNMNSKSCKQAIADAVEAGKDCLKQADYDRAELVVKAIMEHPTASKWLGGKHQVTIIWKDPATGVMCKGRPDILIEGERVVDLKCTDDPTPGKFSRVATNLKYYVQASMYLDGLHCAETGTYQTEWKIPFSFIAAEVTEPFDVVPYNMEVESLEAGRVIFQKAIELYADCQSTGQWPGYSNYAESLEIQQWALHKILYEGDNNV